MAGFTLTELLTVIAIIGILAAILIPVAGKVRESAYSSRCSTNLRNIHGWLTLYAQEHKSCYPPIFAPSPPAFPKSVSWWQLVQLYANPSVPIPLAGETDPAVNPWYCPAAEKTFPEPVRRVYPMNAYGTPQSTPIRPLLSSQPARTLLVADGKHNSGGDSLLYFRDSTAISAEKPAAVLDPRHNGKINGLFLDGHVVPFALTDPQLETWIINLTR